MVEKTHKAGGTLLAVVGLQIMSKHNLLIEDINPALQFIVEYPFVIWGSIAPDFDRDWEGIGNKNFINYYINKILRLFNPIYDKYSEDKCRGVKVNARKFKIAKMLSCRHRSWQTHSDISFIILVLTYIGMIKGSLFLSKVETNDSKLILLCYTGVIIGILSHYILDALTRDGLDLIIPTIVRNFIRKKLKMGRKEKKVKFRLVPNSELFSCGDFKGYEGKVYSIVVTATYTYITLFGIIQIIGIENILELLRLV